MGSIDMSPRVSEADSNAGDSAEPATPERPVATRRVGLRLLMLFCVGMLNAGVARNYLFSKPSGVVSKQEGIVESIPKPSLTPEDVVERRAGRIDASLDNQSKRATATVLVLRRLRTAK